MSEFTPTVTEQDIERLISRDYDPERLDDIRTLMHSVTVNERLRVIAACLKNGNGNYDRLANELSEADGYWRESITEAEYPKIKKASKFTDAEIHEKQKQQYLSWFNRE